MLIGGVIAVLSLVNLVRSLAGMEILKAAMTKGDVLRFCRRRGAARYVWLAPVLGLVLATMALMIVVGLIIRPNSGARLPRSPAGRLGRLLACLRLDFRDAAARADAERSLRLLTNRRARR